MKMKVLAAAVAVSSVFLGGMNSALADSIFGVSRIGRINPLGVGSTTIYGVRVNADTSRWLQNSTRRLAGKTSWCKMAI